MPARRPRVTIFNAQSLDGRLDGFEPDLGVFYGLAAALPQDAVLSGSATIAAAAQASGVRLEEEDERPRPAAARRAEGPWLVLVDSGGRITRFDWLRAQPHWRDVIVLCSGATPRDHLHRLTRLDVAHHVVGDAKVDLAAALALLRDQYGVERIRVDAGPGLNGALLRERLVDEVRVLVAPCLTGESPEALHLVGGHVGPVRLEPSSAQILAHGHVLLAYDLVAREDDGASASP